MTRSALIAICSAAALACAAAPADARWVGVGSGSGAGTVATMPGGNQPSASASSRNVTVSWPQSTFAGSNLGSYTGGGYTVKRYPQGSSSAVTPGSACDTTIAGASATLSCIEGSTPYGAWQYTVTPVLNSFTGAESTKSTTVTVTTAAPALSTVAAQNPATGVSNGDIQVTWASTTGATGYNLYRRTAAGSYDFASPVNGGTPLSTTSYTDAGTGLTGSTTYDYVVRAVAGSPAVESASSNELGATVIARPAAPAGAVTATAAIAARIDVAWSAVSGVAGYNVYRRTAAGSYNFATPLNGASTVSATTYSDTTAVNGTSYFYTVRAVITGAGAAQVESANSAESNSATADSSAPPAPSAVSVTSGGNVLAGLTCSIASGTRFINNAGKASVGVTATISAPESGEMVTFTATTPGSTPVTTTVSAGSTSVSTTLNLTSLLDGVVTLTAATSDALGNTSATTSPTNGIRKDVVAAALSAVTYHDGTLSADTISGTSECGATITALETAGPHVGRVYPLSGTVTVGAGGTFSGFAVETLLLTSYGYTVTATDMAGNASAGTAISGFDAL